MKVHLGYACVSKTLENVTSSSSYTYTRFKEEQDFDKLNRIIESNLEDLEKIIDYNIANHIHFFRISTKLIPLATHPAVKFDYLKKYQSYYKRIGDKIQNSQMRVDFHPDQFCILNSTRKEVVNASIDSLKYHYNLLDTLKIEEKVIILHVGSSTFGKQKSLTRFANQFKKLPENIQSCIVIENDDKIFTVTDCLMLNKKIGVPIVLDYHHFICNNDGEDLKKSIKKVFETWNGKVPKVHFSSPKAKTKKDFRSHSDYIEVEEFIRFIEGIKQIGTDLDIMIEAKAKDEALFRLVRELKYRTNYRFIDETTFIVN